MSYIIGWKNKKSVFLCGDTLLTANFNMNSFEEKSSFGEKLVKTENHSHSEAYLKIWIIGKLAVGFVSSNVYEAVEFLTNLSSEIDQANIYESLDAITRKYNPKDTEFLFIFNEKENNYLVKYDSNFEEIYEEQEPTQLGSLPEGYMDQTYEMCSKIIEEEDNITDDDALVLTNSIHQNLMIVQNSMQFGVGGLFTGLYINSSGITWQKDTVYLNYKVNISLLNSDESNLKQIYTPSSIIQLLIRQNCASYLSGFNSQSTKRDHLFKCWASKTNSIPPEEIIKERVKWNHECLDEIYQAYECPNPNYIVLFSNDPNIARKLVIIRSNGGNPFVIMHCEDNGYYNIDINVSVLRALKPDHKLDHYKYEFVN